VVQHAAAHGLTSLSLPPVSFLSSLALYTRVLTDYSGGGRLCTHVKGYAHTYDPNVSHVILIFSMYKDCMYTVHTYIVLSLSIPLPRSFSFSHPTRSRSAPTGLYICMYCYPYIYTYVYVYIPAAALRPPAAARRQEPPHVPGPGVRDPDVYVCVRTCERASACV
jgi:hypothetical protein